MAEMLIDSTLDLVQAEPRPELKRDAEHEAPQEEDPPKAEFAAVTKHPHVRYCPDTAQFSRKAATEHLARQ